jgi:uncharacterized membrane protein SpoIIM required for sporulation
MVLESLINPTKAKKKPWETFFLGFMYATVGLFLAYWVFREHSSLTMVFLTTLAAAPLLYFTIKSEEEIEQTLPTEGAILKEHAKVLLFLIILFIGITAAFAVLYILLPTSMVNILFSTQTSTISSINTQISGAVTQQGLFLNIFLNNMRVLTFAILFAFLYGVGAIFILTWNASVIGAAIGNFIRKNIANYAQEAGLIKMGTYFNILSAGVLKYAVHGIPEILAYFVGGLAGGIISIAMIKHDLFDKSKERIIFDAAELILLAIVILVIAGAIEVYITPTLFQ